MNENKCKDCFAYQPSSGMCSVLIIALPLKKRCNFYKTKLRFYTDALSAERRLPQSPERNKRLCYYEEQIKSLEC